MKTLILVTALVMTGTAYAATPTVVAAATPTAATPIVATPIAHPVAVVNGVAIPATHAALIMSEQAQRGKQPPLAAVRDKLIVLEVLAQEARKRKIDQDPAFRARAEVLLRNLLADAVLDAELTAHPVKEAAVKAAYDSLKAQPSKNEYHAAHILINDEAVAKTLLADLKKKKPFAALAKKHSKDSGSAQRGGDLGWMGADDLVPEFAKAMQTLKPGQLLETPVKTQFGWHIIRLEGVRTFKFPEFSAVQESLHEQMAQQQVKRIVDQLRAAAKVD
jgi:peptidyl-prolyl cis-trans isomerase C